MIAPEHLEEYAPFGRSYIQLHPGDVSLSGAIHRQLTPFLLANKEKKGNSTYSGNENWELREAKSLESGFCEEELYVINKTVIWSRLGRGVNRSSQKAIKAYTVDSAVTQTLWCSFDVKNYICIIDDKALSFFEENGESFIVPLPFKVKKVYKMSCGLLLERCNSSISSSKLPTLFSLLHPLDEITPIIYRHASHNNAPKFFNDENYEVVETNLEHSWVILYHKYTGHSIWRLRKATPKEVNEVIVQPLRQQYSCVCSPSNSRSSFSRNTFSISSPLHRSSPVSTTRTSTPPKSMIHSPAVSNRTESPSWNTMNSSPSNSRVNQRVLLADRSPTVSGESPKNLANSTMEASPLFPDVCLEHVWTEPLLQGDPLKRKCKAAKVFIHDDFVGQRHLCLVLMSKSCIECIKIEWTQDKSKQEIFGAMNLIKGMDAVPLVHLNMMVVLENSGNLCLYSGLIKVTSIHVTQNMNSFANFSQDFSSLSVNGCSSPPPRRSSLLPSSNESHEVLPMGRVSLSPVSFMEGSESFISSFLSVRDPVRNAFTVEKPDGSYFRVYLPEVHISTLVKKSVEALKQVLPKDASMQLYVKWYSTRNAIGMTNLSCETEWNKFAVVLLGMLGYQVDRLPLWEKYSCEWNSSSFSNEPKKSKIEEGDSEDWQALLASYYNKYVEQDCSKVLGLNPLSQSSGNDLEEQFVTTTSPLFSSLPSILYALHLVYEEFKLNLFLWSSLVHLAELLYQLASDLNEKQFLMSYWCDFPHLNPFQKSVFTEEQLSLLDRSLLTQEPPSIFRYLLNVQKANSLVQPFPFIPDVCSRIYDLVVLYSYLSVQEKHASDPYRAEKYLCHFPLRKKYAAGVSVSISNAVLFMTDRQIDKEYLKSVPHGVVMPLLNTIYYYSLSPPLDWPAEAYQLIGRQDLCRQGERWKKSDSDENQPVCVENKKSNCNKDEYDGMDCLDWNVLRLRFKEDHRVAEVRRLLCSSKPVRISIPHRPEIGEHEVMEEQERYLYAMCTRTMALPVGRGMFTLHSTMPLITETLPIPLLCLSGRATPRNTSVDLSHIDIPHNMNLWPLFHNGVAAGLRISPESKDIGSNWITFNKPKGNSEIPTEHAGFLMGLGLNGHLRKLATLNLHDYLARGHEMTIVGLLLGISADKRESMDTSITRVLSIHVETLLPPNSTELDVPHSAQVAALIGIGLLYQGTAHRHMAELLLEEIGRPPGPEMENSVDRESYSLAAGLALGLVMLGKGQKMSGLADLNIADTLYHFMAGGYKRPFMGAHKEKYKSPSYQIKEDDMISVDITSPGATLALAMMFLKTGNTAVAEWMKAPDTQRTLDTVRPDLLMLQTLARGLILWDDVRPSMDWIFSQVPEPISQLGVGSWYRKTNSSPPVDHELVNQAILNIMAGASLVLGIRFAGSANFEASHALGKRALALMGAKDQEMTAGKATVESCLCITILAWSMVMAGTGDLKLLRWCRRLHSRVPSVGYGSHMAIHMSLGLLFLGGGSYTLATHNSAIAAMLCAFFPKFPTHSNDNRYHLQALRHLYVLAVERRLVVPRSIETGKPTITHLRLVYLDTPWYQNEQVDLVAPVLLQELDMLKEVHVDDSRYYGISFERGKNWHVLQKILKNGGDLPVKRKTGCLDYVEDPKGFQSAQAQTLIAESNTTWMVRSEAMGLFESDPIMDKLSSYYMKKDPAETQLQQQLVSILHGCIASEKLEFVPSFLAFLQSFRETASSVHCSSLLLWQLKLLVQNYGLFCFGGTPVVSREVAVSTQHKLAEILDNTDQVVVKETMDYMKGKIKPKARLNWKHALYITGCDLTIQRIVHTKEAGSLLKSCSNLEIDNSFGYIPLRFLSR